MILYYEQLIFNFMLKTKDSVDYAVFICTLLESLHKATTLYQIFANQTSVLINLISALLWRMNKTQKTQNH